MKLWLDDIRPAPVGWVWVRTVDECCNAIRREVPECLSLDNDLGENEPEGYTVLDWLEQQAYYGAPVPQDIRVHSANPVARARMQVVIGRLGPRLGG